MASVSYPVPMPSPNGKPEVCTESQRRNGDRMAVDAYIWMLRSEQVFNAIYRYVKSLQGDHIKGRVRDRVASYCVDVGLQVGKDSYRFSNSIWAAISRYLVIKDPSLYRAPIEFAKSDIDCVGLYPVPYLEGAMRD